MNELDCLGRRRIVRTERYGVTKEAENSENTAYLPNHAVGMLVWMIASKIMASEKQISINES